MTERSGWLRLSIPNNAAYNHWNDVNNAPQVQTTAQPGDWTVETRVNLSSQVGSSFHGGLMVKFAQNYEYL